MNEPKIIFPSWGQYGIRVEVKPPNENFKNPKLMISEVKKDEQAMLGWKFYMRKFNPSQAERGFYNAHCSIPVDSIPMLIATLTGIWDDIKPEGAEEVSETAREIAQTALYGEQAGEMLRESKDMAELQEPSPTSRHRAAAPAKSGPKPRPAGDDAFDMIRKKKGGPSDPGEPEEDSGGPDDFIPF